LTIAAFNPEMNGEPDKRRKQQRKQLEPKVVQDEGAPRLPELEFEKKGGWKWEINGLQ